MNLMPPLLLIIFLEGYVVLATELLAIRQTVPYVGNATDSVSIIIAAVLMPLAFGYYAGGRFRMIHEGKGQLRSIRKKLLQNLVIATVILTFGLSYVFIKFFFETLLNIGLDGRILLITIYSLLFIVAPVYLLGQTVPLVTNFFSKQRLSALTGRILFVSTLGSFMGAVFCTLVLMATIGVHNTVSVSIGVLFLLTLLLSKKKLSWPVGATLACFAASLILNGKAIPALLESDIPFPPATVAVYAAPPGQIDNPETIGFIDRNFIAHAGNRDILVIGNNIAIGKDDAQNNYTRLNETQARDALKHGGKKFDLIIIDTAHGYNAAPPQLLTREFFQQVKSALKDGGIVVANFGASPNYSDEFTANLDLTFRSVFPHVNREVIGFYDGWNRDPEERGNIIYSYFHENMPDTVYTDNLNRSYSDRGRFVD